MLRVTFIGGSPQVSVECCNSPDDVATHDLTMNYSRVIETAQLFRSAKVENFDRKNVSNELSFVVERRKDDAGTEFTGPAAALAWFTEHINSLPGTGNVTVDVQDTAQSISFWLNSCALPSVQMVRHVGPLLTLRYTFTGGIYVFDDPNLS